MITFMTESFCEIYPEVRPLLDAHYKEISQHYEHGEPLIPRMDYYKAQEDAGVLMTVIGREAGEIVAYFQGFVAPGLHYRNCLTCTPDVFYVRPDKRKGRVGIKLFQATEKELKRRGVKLWFVGSKNAHDSSALLKFLKFSPTETMYSKWLGD